MEEQNLEGRCHMDRKPVEIRDFLALRYVSDPRFSPDGQKAAFLVTRIDPDQNAYLSDLWVLDVGAAGPRRLTETGDVKGYFWDATGGIVSWQYANGGTVVYRMDPESGERRDLFTLPLTVNKLRLLEGELYALTSFTSAQEDPARYHILEEAPFCSNGQGITAGRRSGLYLYRGDTGTLTKLTEDKADAGDFAYRAGKLVYQATPWENYLPYPYGPALYVHDCAAGTTRQLTEVGQISSFALCFWRDDELLFSGIEGCPGKSMGQNTDFYTLSLGDGAVHRFADVDMKIGYGGSGSDAKYGGGQGICLGRDGVYFLAPVMDGTCVNRMDFDGTVHQNVTEAEGFSGSVESFDIHGGAMICAKMVPNGLVELYLDGKQVTDFNGAYLRSHDISQPEFLTFSSRDGVTLHGFCMKPRGYVPGRRYPGILHIHGGPKTIFGDIFHHEMQLWASRGFFVFYCNPRGSDGRGRDFADIRGRWGTVDYTDIMDFTNAVLEGYPDIDPDRVGVCGGSYGGFMTNWIIGHTDRFAAACSQRSFANMINFEYLSDIGLTNIRSEHMGSAEENVEALWNESPLKYAPRCKTPTLFVHSDQDFRCPLPDALEMFSCLKRAGCPARLCLFHGENHELSRSGRPDNRITRLEEIVSWFERYLK